ncbi:YbdK family carboxylate-amine ligase [Streptomyces kanamyceticus]|uniref:Putative glutamate--cysteine ligase 2 n=1 Tax=Streptomyces kanamyceticus TaxID=1967 RepID=A0A5J6GP42_STRKN|nr:glutamate--cysteine ligase [Streptomyces kanamyceticus]QEU97077.1 YbdK family carboxylate-amine ligase [Streptomyces kanamyceticus]
MASTGQTPVGAQEVVAGHGQRRTGTGEEAVLTVGAEEEYLLVDPVTRHVRPAAREVVAQAASVLGPRVGTEITRYQVEVRTDPHTSLTEFAAQLRSTRAAAARAAARQGLRIVSSGTPVLGQVTPAPLTAGPRYARSAAMFGALDDEQSACACHIHVGVPNLATALEISNHLRPWIPVLIALTANSPYWAGRDTGYASWRTTIWGRWPVAGPPPYFESPDHFEGLVSGLLTTGAVMDRGGLYWDIRPSHHVPTLEFRAADASTTAGETVLLAGLARAMVATALRAVDAGERAPRPGAEMLRAACWRAARDGLGGDGIDLPTGRLTPFTDQVDRLLVRLTPALRDHGDIELVRTLWTRLRADGSGADR